MTAPVLPAGRVVADSPPGPATSAPTGGDPIVIPDYGTAVRCPCGAYMQPRQECPRCALLAERYGPPVRGKNRKGHA